MANPEHVEIARCGAEAITAFHDKNQNVRLDLSGANLRSANLRNANLSSANLGDADLSDADLRTADLRGAYLSFADLTRANLSRANLSVSDLSRANLISTDLSDADLSIAYLIDASLICTNLSGANLSGANLSRAYLIDADLGGANLNDANLSRAVLNRARFGNIDLSQTMGLESVTHHGPSTIGVDTLFLSNAKIPGVFLRGCGLPEEFITNVLAFVGTSMNFCSCFISYNKADRQFAQQLHDRLQSKGIRCWLDEKDLPPGDDLYHEIDRGMRVWDKVLLCASMHSLTSWWVDNEIAVAHTKELELARSTKEKTLNIIPLNLDDYMFNDDWKSGHRAMLRERVVPDFRKWKTDADEFDRQFERVLKALRTDGRTDVG